MTDPIASPPPCSLCGGVWIQGLTHQHTMTCPRYDPETRRIATDFYNGPGVRPATETEQEIIHEHDYDRPDHGAYWIRHAFRAGLHRRIVLTGTEPRDAKPVERSA